MIGRFLRTVRWLRPGQIAGRIRYQVLRPRPDLRPAPARRRQRGEWRQPPAREASLLGPGRWRLLNQTHDLADAGWDNPSIDLLWRYNQHYFDDLNAAGASQRRPWHDALLARWEAENPPGVGTAWAPYTTSLRIVNLVKAGFDGLALGESRLHSLAVQARWLTKRIEWHLLGNHLFSNAKALVFAGLFFEGREADEWLAIGLAILRRELREQFMADGAHFELTPMYQSLAIEDLLDILNVIRCLAAPGCPARELEGEFIEHSRRALEWLTLMLLGDGRLARFNDCADGIAPGYDALCRYAASLAVPVPSRPAQGQSVLQPSGYVSWRRGDTLLIADVGDIGPDYLPGHAHADTLSFELSLGSNPFIVNRGTSVYGTGVRRQVERGTAAHSTLQVGNEDSSEVWAGFRVGRRARARVLIADGKVLEACHDGFRHLPGEPVHRRRWILSERSLEIHDWIDGRTEQEVRVRYHLAPGLHLHRSGAEWQARDTDTVVRATAVVEGGEGTIEQWEHAEGFGLLVPAETLVLTSNGQRHVYLRWSW